MANLITRPLRQTVDVIREIAEGDLSREIRLDTKDEIGELAQAVDTMRLKMGEAVGQSAATSMTLSDSASRQAASLEETSSSIEEMASMIKNSAQNAAQTNQLMSASQDVIKKCRFFRNPTQRLHEGDHRSQRTDPEDRKDHR